MCIPDQMDITGLDWSSNRILPAFQRPQHLDVYDIRGTSPEVQLSITTLVGLINRPQPRVYLIINDDDTFWLKEVFAAVPQAISPISKDDVLEALLLKYRNSTQGLIIYNPDFLDSINIATTMAGQQGAIVVSPAQAQILQAAHALLILDDLRTYQWRNRLEAYYWAYQHLLSGASQRLVAGLNPSGPHGFRAFLVATGAFVYWLDSRNIIPSPTIGWLSERSLMARIFSTLPPGGVHLGWFIDEASGVAITSDAAQIVLATDYYYNLEVWTSVQPTTPIAQQVAERQTPQALAPKVYVSFTMSEGDNLQYNQHRLAHLWRDAARASIPIGWTTSPLLLQAAPTMAAYYARTATPNDELLAGPSGAGYMFPSRWPTEQLPTFLQRTGELMQKMNLAVLEVLDTGLMQSGCLNPFRWRSGLSMAFYNAELQERFVQALSPFGLRGILSGNGQGSLNHTIVEGVPIYQNLGLAMSVQGTIDLIRKVASANRQRPLFLNVYVLAWNITPSDLAQVMQALGSEYQAVTPGTLLTMLKEMQDSSVP